MAATTNTQNFFRVLLALILLLAGASHLTIARVTFQAQVPNWVPLSPDFVVVASGIVEILLGLALLFWVSKLRMVGWITAIYFLCIFPGNLAQYMNHRDAFGLNSDSARFVRLLFHPILIIWPLWCTGILKRQIPNT